MAPPSLDAGSPEYIEIGSTRVPVRVGELWTAKQRAGHNLHEISYRACFKPQLPAYYISRHSQPGETVYDPFMGRGTTVLEAALQGRVPWGNDASPLSAILTAPRLDPPRQTEVEERLSSLSLDSPTRSNDELLTFYHPDTLREILNLREYLLRREATGALDSVDAWIRMVAVNRLTGHSAGFFSVYSLPPNQAASVASQRRINDRLRQVPPRRPVKPLLLRKSKALLSAITPEERARLRSVSGSVRLLTGDAAGTSPLPSGSVRLVVTSPPFLNIVDYAKDNWLRNWFCGIDPRSVHLTQAGTVAEWEAKMTEVFRELARLLAPGGAIAFEVGEVRNGQVRLEESVVRSADRAGLHPIEVFVNAQHFTKTAHCWGITNGSRGTNTNRVVLLSREGLAPTPTSRSA